MQILNDYKLNMENFKNSYSNDINILKKLLNLNENATINDILKLSIKSKKFDYYNYNINVNKRINYKNIDIKYIFVGSENNSIFLWRVIINTNDIQIIKYYCLNSTKIYGINIYIYDNGNSSYQKYYNFNSNKLQVRVPSFSNIIHKVNFYNDMHFYKSKNSELIYIINDKIYDIFPTNIKKYKNLIKYINSIDDLINLKRLRLYVIYLYLNKILTINESKKLINLINSRILMLYLID